ncbi:MAG: peptidase [Planctomycetaceae bacterium]
MHLPIPLRHAVCAALLAAVGGGVRADRVELADGRLLDGRFTFVDAVAGDPFADEEEGDRPSGPILVCDDELVRTMVSKRRVVRVEPAPVDLGMERLLVPQRVPEQGRRVAGIGAIVGVTPFDDFGRRTLSLATADGRVDVVQGITEITPRWVRVQGLQTERPLILDMRLATSSVPHDVLRRVMTNRLDRDDSEQRLRLVRLLLQAERYEDARRELDDVLEDFPDLADLAKERAGIARLAAVRLLDEILLRGRAGQDRLAIELLERFPAEGADVETIEAIREARDDYRGRRERAAALVDEIRRRVSRLGDAADRDAATAVADEIERGLTFATLGRLATFERLGLAPEVPPDRAVALAVSGWLGLGGVDNLKVALSAVRVRGFVRDYLGSTAGAERDAARAALADEEAGDARTVAAVAAGMRPPLEPPPAAASGLHELAVPALADEQPLDCLVQLPPEYDPLRRYPAIVALHGGGSAPQAELEWWAGVPDAAGVRQGQAGRHGFILVAPAWTRPGQSACEYSAREHAAVLTAVRESLRRFSIDTDRVFLAGHAAGADAAWDVALAHPDLWAGVVLIAPTADRYVTRYWPNARTLPFYMVGGELDVASLRRNAVDLDRYLSKGFDVTYVEYRGRGHEHFSDEILRIFDWLGRKRRTFFPAEIEAVSMRPWDRFFWWLEMEGAPARTVVLPTDWPPPANTRPCTVEGRTTATNGITARCGADRVRVWLSPELLDFTRPVTVAVDGRTLHKGPVAADLAVLLEDLRLRCDRQHPFHAVVESTRGPRGK